MSRFAALAALATMAAPALSPAQVQGSAVNGGSPSTAKLVSTVRASVASACGFTPGAPPQSSLYLGEIDRPFDASIPFTLRCNSPLRVAIVSSNGALQAGDVVSVPTGYTNRLPYQVTLSLVGNGGVTPAQASCASTNLMAGAAGCAFRGPAASTNGLLLAGPSSDAPGSSLRLSSPGAAATPILVSSESYGDRLTVTISPAT